VAEPASFMLSGKPQKHFFLHVPKDCWSFGGNNRTSEQPFFFWVRNFAKIRKFKFKKGILCHNIPIFLILKKK